MSTSTIERYFHNRVEELIAEFTGHTLIFFKGFGLNQIQQLISHPNSLLNDETLLHEKFLDLDAIDDKWLELATSIKNETKPLVGFYEELLAIRQLLPRMDIDKIIVVENNILSPWVPCCYPYNSAELLFDYWQTEQEPQEGSMLAKLCQIYGDVKLLNGGKALLLPTSLDDDRIETVPFWQGCVDSKGSFENDYRDIVIDSADDWEYCFDMTNGMLSPAHFIQNGDRLSNRTKAVLCAANQLGIEISLDKIDTHKEKVAYNDDPFVEILQKYWGNAAQFRPLLFYKDPDRSQETEIINQGQIIAEIVEQCEAALRKDGFSNVFITAPTGSGKSILFQIPAIYLAEKYNLVTIVVSPLIALMNDQVDQLQRERGISVAACINSSMSMEERYDVVEQIHAGKKSLLYLAPELLLTTHLQSFLGGRQLGMVVIDEAHTVTSWGRNFRSDYWFLGDFLKQTARDGLTFPVLCLTATAVYSGDDDVVNDTIHELGLGKTIIHLGNVKRNNISFDIQRHNRDEVDGRIESAKMDLTLRRMREYIADDEKVLTYFPYRSHVDAIYSTINTLDRMKIRRYHGQLPSGERKMVERDYKAGTAMGLFCTKAFGMGIDVGDIKHVVHFAPSGTLADYVQEIGRAARNTEINGIAHIDYFPGDLRYVRALNGISEMRQYQLREMLKKICSIQRTKGKRNLLISAETFEYLFKEKDVENKTKSGLLLLSKDLSNKYTFPVLIVRPKAMLSKNYVNVPNEIETEFLRLYGSYSTFQQGRASHTVSSRNQSRASDMTVYSLGKTFLVDMAGIWENCYPDLSFGMFKKEFFDREFSVKGGSYTVSPRVKVEISYSDDYDTISQRVEKIITAITQIFEKYKTGEKKQFTQIQFEAELAEMLGEKVISHEKAGMLLDIFTESVNEDAAYTQNRSRVRVLRSRKMSRVEETVYFVSNSAYARLPNLFVHQIGQCGVNTENNSFFRFYPLLKNKQIEIMPLLRFMELLELATYEIRGGEKSEVFIRINDPEKLQRLASSTKYTNTVLQTIQEQHRRNESLLMNFFATEMDDDERWELIEQYFLGNEEYVKQVLHIAD